MDINALCQNSDRALGDVHYGQGWRRSRRRLGSQLTARGYPMDLIPCDDVATRVQSLFHLDAADALRKALNEG